MFVVGAPRSGTTWLQRMLGSVPQIATPQETQLFDGYVRSWYALWEKQLPEDPAAWRAARHRGLPAVLTEQQFTDLVGSLVATVFDAVLTSKPGSTVVLDKNPDNALLVELLVRVCPQAKIIHILRDGRDVATSLVSARQGWGRSWAPRNTYSAAESWAHYVTSAQRARDLAPYLETRYEDLQTDGLAELRRCFDFLELEVDDARLEQIYAAESFDRRKQQHAAEAAPTDSIVWGGEVVARLGGAPAEPKGFFREGTSGTWAASWTPYERWSFDQAAATTLHSAGYAPDPLLAGLPSAQRKAFEARLSAWLRARQVYRSAKASPLVRDA